MEGVHVEMHVIRLTFDYVRKDRRERAYIMEDLNSAEVSPHIYTMGKIRKKKVSLHLLFSIAFL